MQEDLAKIEEAGIHVVAVSYDPQPALAKFAKKKKISYPLLADEESAVIEAFGILNDKNPRNKIAHPTTFIVDQDGKIAAKITKGGYLLRHDSDELIEVFNAPADSAGEKVPVVPEQPVVNPAPER